MDAQCYLKTMGYPELRTPDGRLVRLKVRKHLALLVYFAIEGRSSHRREKLVDLLWRPADARPNICSSKV